MKLQNDLCANSRRLEGRLSSDALVVFKSLLPLHTIATSRNTGVPMGATTAVKAQMKLADIFSPAAIRLSLENHTKLGVIEELVAHLIEIGSLKVEGKAALVTSIMAREKLGTTALGNGIAFPHCHSGFAERFVGALAVDKRGVLFNAVDGAPVFAVFLLVVPPEEREQQYELLGKITAIGRDKVQRLQLRGCRTPEAVHDLLRDLD